MLHFTLPKLRYTVVALAALLLGPVVALASCSADRAENVGTTKDELWTPGWSYVGGLTSGVSLSTSAAGQLDAWTRATDGTLYRRTLNIANWGAWAGPMSTPPGGITGVPAASAVFGDHVFIVAKDPNHAVWTSRWTRSTNTMTAWSAVGTTWGFANGSPAVNTALISSTQWTYVAVRGTNNELFISKRNESVGSWSGWIAGGAPPGLISASPGILIQASRLHVVVRATDGSSWYRNYDGTNWSNFSGQPSGWEPLGGIVNDSPAVTKTASGGIIVYNTAPNNTIFSRARNSGGTWGAWIQEGFGPTGGVLGGQDPGLAVLFRNTVFPRGTDMVVRAADTTLFHKQWYDTVPTVTATTAREKTFANQQIWENNAYAVPPNKANCGAEGALLISTCPLVPGTPRVLRTNLSCVTSSSCTPTITHDVTLGSANWPMPSFPGVIDEPGGWDAQIARQVDGSILLLRQGSRRNAGTSIPCPGSASCRGTQYFFRSLDCGATWSFVTMIDPAFNGPPWDPDRYYNPNNQEGHDRPELYVDPWIPGRVYLTMTGLDTSPVPDANDVAKHVLYRSDNYGTTWQFVNEWNSDQMWAPGFMTSFQNGKLYIVGIRAGQPISIHAITYDPATGAFTGPLVVATSDLVPIVGSRSTPLAITRLGSFQDGDYISVHYASVTGSAPVMKSRTVRISGTSISTVNSSFYFPPSGTSITGLTGIDSDRLEWPDNNNVNPGMVYWFEVKTTPSPDGNSGPARLMYRLVFDNGVGSSQCMSLTGGSNTCRTWPLFHHGGMGDYQKGAFWIDAATARPSFLALWGEQTSLNAGSPQPGTIKMNSITVAF